MVYDRTMDFIRGDNMLFHKKNHILSFMNDPVSKQTHKMLRIITFIDYCITFIFFSFQK